MKELIAHAKANPGKVTFASQGAGSTAHLSANLIDLLAGTEMVHVPYRGAVPALNAMVAGQIDFFFDTVTTSTPQHRAGNVKIIGVGGTERSPVLPEAPPVVGRPAGLPLGHLVRHGRTARPAAGAGEPRSIRTSTKASKRPEIADRLQKLTLEPMLGTPADAAKFFAEETALWGRVIKEKNIVVQ